jgi:hypothetical protein
MSQFDPQAFLDTQTNESNDTRVIPCPVGEWAADIDSVDVKSAVSQKTGEPWTKLNVKWKITNTEANTIADRDPIFVTQGVMLEITEAGGLDMGKGKNVQLGRLREAVGLNSPGAPFSFRMLIGRSAKVKVDHREYEGNMFDEVKGVIKLA